MNYLTEYYKNQIDTLEEYKALLESLLFELSNLNEDGPPPRTGLDLRHVSDRVPTTNIDVILDRISRYGKGNLTPKELEVLSRATAGRQPRSVGGEPTGASTPTNTGSNPSGTVNGRPVTSSAANNSGKPNGLVELGPTNTGSNPSGTVNGRPVTSSAANNSGKPNGLVELGPTKTPSTASNVGRTVARNIPTVIKAGRALGNMVPQQLPTAGQVVRGGAKQVAKLVTIPAEVVTSTVKSMNPVKRVPGGVGVNFGGIQRIGGLGAGIGGMIGSDLAMDAVGIKDQSWANAVRIPLSYAVGGAADVAGAAIIAGAVPSAAAMATAAAGGAAVGAVGYGSYKLGEYIGDKTGLHDAIGNALGGASELNTAKTGLRGGVPGINIKNDAEDAEEEAKLKRARDIEAKANQMAGKPTVVPAGQMEYDDAELPDEFFSSPEEAAAYRNQRAK